MNGIWNVYYKLGFRICCLRFIENNFPKREQFDSQYLKSKYRIEDTLYLFWFFVTNPMASTSNVYAEKLH